MVYPSLEQYNEALQHPSTSLTDHELKRGNVKTTGLGLPLALCGGFALTYTISAGSKQYAARCFHKKSDNLEKRYQAISAQLDQLKSNYFVDFEFQPSGVNIQQKSYPLVKMAWAKGKTLGEFVETNYKNPELLGNLRKALGELAAELETFNIAHGDIQPGNVMVSNNGQKLQLIDYDGMFVQGIANFGSAELGHRNFQHPGRESHHWTAKLDRFSFISLELALRALESDSSLWNKTKSDGDSFLFKANDFADHQNSLIFNELKSRNDFAKLTADFSAICSESFDQIPSLSDFIAQRNIPKLRIQTRSQKPKLILRYLSSYPVLDAQDYHKCLQHVGDRVELIGKIVEVKRSTTRHRQRYIFINFGPWKGDIVKINIWSNGLSELTSIPDQSWIGKWISVGGLMEPPYRNYKFNYSHLSISITKSNQMHIISAKEAKYRLAGTSSRSALISSPTKPSNHRPLSSADVTNPQSQPTSTSNEQVLSQIHGNKSNIPAPSKQNQGNAQPQLTQNQAILQAMQAQPSGTYQSKNQPTPTNDDNNGCITMAVVTFILFSFLLLLFGQ